MYQQNMQRCRPGSWCNLVPFSTTIIRIGLGLITLLQSANRCLVDVVAASMSIVARDTHLSGQTLLAPSLTLLEEEAAPDCQ